MATWLYGFASLLVKWLSNLDESQIFDNRITISEAKLYNHTEKPSRFYKKASIKPYFKIWNDSCFIL